MNGIKIDVILTYLFGCHMSKRIGFLITSAIALTLLGCNSNERTYYIKYARIRSLRNSAPVLCEQAPVGVLTGLSNLADETLLLKIELNKEFLLRKTIQ